MSSCYLSTPTPAGLLSCKGFPLPSLKKAASLGLPLVLSLLITTGCSRSGTEKTASPDSVSASHASTAICDTLVIGDDGSEKTHGVATAKCERSTGGLGEPAMKLLPSETKAWESSPLEFTLKIDPERQNYITARLWGSDKGEELGRLLLYIDGKQLGYRGAGDYSTLNQADEEAEAPGRFFYQTLPLPLEITRGKSTVAVKVVALGRRWWYGPTFEQYQKPFTKESRGLYRFYTHTDCYFVPPAEEKQGEAPKASVRPAPGEEVMEKSREVVINRINRLLANDTLSNNPKASFSFGPAQFLAAAYNTSWTPAYRNPAVIDRIVEIGDARAADFSKDPATLSKSWIGAGPLGEAIMATWPEIGKRMEEKVRVGETEVPRSEAWSAMLKASMEYWRTHRRSYTNQSMIVDWGIYTANRGLALVNPPLALPEAKAMRYLYEAVGIEPWLGSDQGGEATGEKDVPFQNVSKPYGSHYHLVTKKGLSRELGFVAGYGETILRFIHDMAESTGDEKLHQQLLKIANARLVFRYPALDADGFRCMKLCSEIDERGEHFPIPGAAYAANFASRENWGMELPSLFSDDPKIVGAAQQSLEDNQYFALIASRLKGDDSLGLMRNLDQFAKVKALPPSPARLPMSEGQPDFVFADEENAVLALKQGQTRLFANLYFRAENGVNRVARILEITPRFTRIATVKTEVEVEESGETFVRPDHLQGIRNEERLKPPGDTSHQAWAGEVMPIAKRPDDATQPAYGNWGPFVGKAAFYRLQYGNFLIGLNTTENRTFTLATPKSFSQAKDLVSGETKSGEVKVGPLSTVVLDLGEKP